MTYSKGNRHHISASAAVCGPKWSTDALISPEIAVRPETRSDAAGRKKKRLTAGAVCWMICLGKPDLSARSAARLKRRAAYTNPNPTTRKGAQQMKALLINGSPRPRGCTYTALTELKKTLEAEGVEVELIHVAIRTSAGVSPAANVMSRAAASSTTRSTRLPPSWQRQTPLSSARRSILLRRPAVRFRLWTGCFTAPSAWTRP